ncbi:MAG: hypothetical protein JXR94_16225 [Candidatus Hydrogenedentes bacterium]|nr:hypothetical protein [Candidatus Hydrogenedentota bacterium]
MNSLAFLANVGGCVEMTFCLFVVLVAAWLVFMGIGTLVYGRVRKRPRPTMLSWRPDYLAKPSKRQRAWPSQTSRLSPGGRVTLKPRISPVAVIGWCFVLAGLFAGAAFFSLWQALKAFRAEDLEWVPALYYGLGCAVVGALLTASTAMLVLKRLSPWPVLTLSTAAPVLGEPFDIEWLIHDPRHSVERLRILLVGAEEATFSRSRKSETESNVFAVFLIADCTSYAEIVTGHAQISVPAETMHSFKSEHNEILWSLLVGGSVAQRPNIGEEFPIVVLPRPGQGGSQ